MTYEECMLLIHKANKLFPAWYKNNKYTSWNQLKKSIALKEGGNENRG